MYFRTLDSYLNCIDGIENVDFRNSNVYIGNFKTTGIAPFNCCYSKYNFDNTKLYFSNQNMNMKYFLGFYDKNLNNNSNMAPVGTSIHNLNFTFNIQSNQYIPMIYTDIYDSNIQIYIDNLNEYYVPYHQTNNRYYNNTGLFGFIGSIKNSNLYYYINNIENLNSYYNLNSYTYNGNDNNYIPEFLKDTYYEVTSSNSRSSNNYNIGIDITLYDENAKFSCWGADFILRCLLTGRRSNLFTDITLRYKHGIDNGSYFNRFYYSTDYSVFRNIQVTRPAYDFGFHAYQISAIKNVIFEEDVETMRWRIGAPQSNLDRYFNANIIIKNDNITDCSYLLNYCQDFNAYITIPNSLVDAFSMFCDCYNFNQTIDMNLPDTLTNASSMFKGCRKLKGTLTNLPSRLSRADSMFSECENLTIQLNKLDNNSLQNLDYYFYSNMFCNAAKNAGGMDIDMGNINHTVRLDLNYTYINHITFPNFNTYKDSSNRQSGTLPTSFPGIKYHLNHVTFVAPVIDYFMVGRNFYNAKVDLNYTNNASNNIKSLPMDITIGENCISAQGLFYNFYSNSSYAIPNGGNMNITILGNNLVDCSLMFNGMNIGNTSRNVVNGTVVFPGSVKNFARAFYCPSYRPRVYINKGDNINNINFNLAFASINEIHCPNEEYAKKIMNEAFSVPKGVSNFTKYSNHYYNSTYGKLIYFDWPN